MYQDSGTQRLPHDHQQISQRRPTSGPRRHTAHFTTSYLETASDSPRRRPKESGHDRFFSTLFFLRSPTATTLNPEPTPSSTRVAAADSDQLLDIAYQTI